MRILITGATGFIGGRLVKRLAPQHEVYALVRRQPTRPGPDCHYIFQDLCQPLDYSQLPPRLDAIIHQAAMINAETAVDDTVPFLVNVMATWRLLAYAAKTNVGTFMHASTGGIYGCGARPFRETDRPNPMDLYSLTKAQAELAVQAAPGSFHKIVLRYFFPYGVGTPNPIPDYVKRAVRGKAIEVMQGGGPKLNPIHISDAVEATVQALHLKESLIVNIAGNESTTFASIAELAADMAGRKAIFQPYPDADAIAYYQSDILANTDRMNATLHLQNQTTLYEGIAELVAHYDLPKDCLL